MTRQKPFTEEETETKQQSRDRLGEFFQQSHRLSLLNLFTLYEFNACPWEEMAIDFTYIIMKRTQTLLELLFYLEFNTTVKDDVTQDSKKSDGMSKEPDAGKISPLAHARSSTQVTL